MKKVIKILIELLIIFIAFPFFVIGMFFRVIQLGFMAGMGLIEELSDSIQEKIG